MTYQKKSKSPFEFTYPRLMHWAFDTVLVNCDAPRSSKPTKFKKTPRKSSMHHEHVHGMNKSQHTTFTDTRHEIFQHASHDSSKHCWPMNVQHFDNCLEDSDSSPGKSPALAAGAAHSGRTRRVPPPAASFATIWFTITTIPSISY